MKTFEIAGRKIGEDQPCYIIAEISCNHNGDFNEARRIIEASAKAGADAVKTQSYTPDTISRNFSTRPKGTIWEKMDLYSLYQKAYTPWEWHKDLKKVAADCGVHIFSSPFDETAVDHLEDMGVPVYKIASFEVVDLKLIEKVARTGKPVLISNGMTNFLEMDEAVRALRDNGTKDLAILHCNSGYPAAFEEANLATIPAIADIFDCVVGLSDHTLYADTRNWMNAMAHITPVEAVKFGAKIIEIHVMTDRQEARALMEKGEGGFDWPFSREPHELEKIVRMIRAFEKGEDVEYGTAEERRIAQTTHGAISFDPTEKEIAGRALRPSLWVVKDIKAGEQLKFAPGGDCNIDSIRPGGGLEIRFADMVNGKAVATDISAGTPLQWDHIKITGRARQDPSGSAQDPHPSLQASASRSGRR